MLRLSPQQADFQLTIVRRKHFIPTKYYEHLDILLVYLFFSPTRNTKREELITLLNIN